MSFHREKKFILTLLQVLSKQFHVRLDQISINTNHLHLLVHAKERSAFQSFLMAVSGRIAQRMTGSKKGSPQQEKFWDFIPFTRIVEWGKDFFWTKAYVIKNQLETDGIIPYQPRQRKSAVPTG